MNHSFTTSQELILTNDNTAAQYLDCPQTLPGDQLSWRRLATDLGIGGTPDVSALSQISFMAFKVNMLYKTLGICRATGQCR